MSLKSIRESYSALLNVFNDAGIKITESQKKELDGFVINLESNITKQREDAIKKTEKKLEREYKQVFESILDNMHKNSDLTAKIQKRKIREEEKNAITNKVSDYLDLYVESVLPKKSIVDYDKLQTLSKKKCDNETQIAKLTVKLNEATAKNKTLADQLAKAKSALMLESKVKCLPAHEAKIMRKLFAESTEAEIEKNFDHKLKEVQKKTDKDMFIIDRDKIDETVTKPTVDEIINQATRINEATPDYDVNPDDEDIDDELPDNTVDNIWKGKKYSKLDLEPDFNDPEYAEKYDNIGDDEDIVNHHLKNGYDPEDDEDIQEAEKPFETLDEVKFDQNGDIALDEDDVINESTMQWYCNHSIELT